MSGVARNWDQSGLKSAKEHEPRNPRGEATRYSRRLERGANNKEDNSHYTHAELDN
jgi:hypothetical protein